MAAWERGDLWDPSNPENRDRTRRLQRELRAHLLAWDPIGVGDAPEAQDEYDAYISPLLHMLHRGEPSETVTAYLTSVVEDSIELPSQPEREREFGAMLTRWWAERVSG